MKTVKLITCDDAFQAHIIQGALANEGIDSLLHNENMSTLLRGFVHDISGVDVLVADCDYESDDTRRTEVLSFLRFGPD